MIDFHLNNYSFPSFITNLLISESCLNQHLLRQPNGETNWQLPAGTHVFSVQLILPSGLTCSQCVLQWKWNTGMYFITVMWWSKMGDIKELSPLTNLGKKDKHFCKGGKLSVINGLSPLTSLPNFTKLFIFLAQIGFGWFIYVSIISPNCSGTYSIHWE